jgi:hypothetical protein
MGISLGHLELLADLQTCRGPLGQMGHLGHLEFGPDPSTCRNLGLGHQDTWGTWNCYLPHPTDLS